MATICVQWAYVHVIDELSWNLDVKQRLKAARTIRGLLTNLAKKCVIVVEHNLVALDYLSNYVCCLYGRPRIYGAVTAPFSALGGIDISLAAHVPTENLRSRTEDFGF